MRNIRRKLLVGAISTLGVVLVLLIAVFWYVRSGRLDARLEYEIEVALRDVGIDARFERVSLDIRGYKVTLNGVTLSSLKSGKELGKIDEVVVEFSVLDYLRQKVEINEIMVTRPTFHFEVDPQGRTFIDDLHAPPERPKDKEAITFTDAYIEVKEGRLTFDDKVRNINGEVPDFYAKFNFTDESFLERSAHAFEFGFSKPASLTFDGRKVDNVNAHTIAVLGETSASIREFWISSNLGRVDATGALPGYKPLQYDLKVESELLLGEIGRIFAPANQLGGKAKFTGTISGSGSKYKVDGALNSDSLTAEGLRVNGVKVETNVSGSGSDYNATGDLSAGPISGRGVQINSVRLSSARVTGKEGDFDLTGGLSIPALKSGKIAVSGIRGAVTADPDHLRLSGFTASVIGGSLTGNASVGLSGGASSVDLQFKSLDLNQAAAMAASDKATVRGTVSGTAKLAFPGFKYEAATGRVDATFDARVSPPEAESEGAPANGQISLVATGRGFTIEKALVHSQRSDLTATGNVGWNGVGSVDVKFKSEDMAEVQRVIDSFGVIPEEIREQHKIAVEGAGEFTGRLEGDLASPSVSGHLALDSVRADQDEIGTFEGDIHYTPSLLRVDKASVVRPDGGRADFSFNAPLEGKDNMSLNAKVTSFDLPTLVRAGAPEFKEFVGRGLISGNIDLKGLPGPRSIEGTADVTLSSGEFQAASDEDGKAPATISVPEFKGDVSFANSVLSVRDLKVLVGDSEIAGQGTFNLDTYAYSINAEGKNVDLTKLSEAAQTVNITGRADLTVTGNGLWKEWSDINLNGTLQGRNVTVEGREVGDAKLAAFTENGLLKLEVTGNVLDQARTLAATVDLRERKTLPVSANIEFTDVDMAPYLGLVSPELSSLSGRATGTITLSGPLLDAQQVFSADGIRAVATLTKLQLGGAINERQRYTIDNEGPVVISAGTNEITVSPVTFTGEGTSIRIGGAISRGEASRTNIAVNGEINLRFVSSFIDTVFTTGIAQVEASIAGSLDSPRLLGFVNLKDVGVRVVNLPLSIARGNGQIRFTSDQALIENFTATTPGGGTLIVTGGAALSGLVPDRWRLEAEADQIGVEYPRDTQSVFDASLVFQGSRRFQGVLSGEVDIRRAAYTKEITLDDLISTGGPFGPEFTDIGPGGGGGAPLPITADLRITADNTLIVRNNLADALGSAFLNVRGPLSDPSVSGRVMLSQGTLQFRNDRYELSRGLITFPPKRRAEPILDIQAESDIGGYRVSVNFSDTLSKLKTTLRSDPELPENDIVALILTGSVSGGRTEAAVVTQSGLGLAQSILAASLSERLEKGTRLLGLSRFSIDPILFGRGNDPTARVTVGRRITKDLTITYSQNLTSGPSGVDRVALVEYRLSNRFSLVGVRNERGELGFDVRIRKRF
jgi:translocation and assembly module TamB